MKKIGFCPRKRMCNMTRNDQFEECLRLLNICIDLLDQAYEKHLEDSKLEGEG